MDEITIVNVPAQKVLGITKTGTYQLIPDLLMQVAGYIISEKGTIAGPPVFICHETSPESVKEANENGTAVIEVAWPVMGTVKGSGEITAYELPGGKMVHAIHRGPYEECEPTYRKLFTWIADNSLVMNGPIREVYPNDPREVKPEDIITEIFVPVE